MKIKRKLAIQILKYLDKYNDFYFPFLVMNKEYTEEDNDFVEIEPNEWENIESDEKYGEVPRLFKRPLQIILVGYQEYEARKGYAFGDLLDENNQTKELHESLAFYKKHDIEYVAFTDILQAVGIKNGCWNKKIIV